MYQWQDAGCWEMVKRLQQEPLYQELQASCREAQQAYHKVMKKLTLEEQNVVEDYIALCEELQFQQIHAAYYCGKADGVASLVIKIADEIPK